MIALVVGLCALGAAGVVVSEKGGMLAGYGRRIVISAIVGLFAFLILPAQAADVKFDPVKDQIGQQTAECMFDWIRGSLNRGLRDEATLISSAVTMCSGMARKFGWKSDELTVLAFVVLDHMPGVRRK